MASRHCPAAGRRRIFVVLALIFALVAPATLSAIQVQDMTFVSPVTGQKFQVLAVPVEQSNSASLGALADMGADDDGCRHSSGLTEYDYYIATCPYTYFSALSVEWDEKTGIFLGEVTPDLKDWVRKTFNTDWQIDVNKAYQNALLRQKNEGGAPLDRKSFVMSQQAIAIEKKYSFALQCYEKRGARPAVLAKIALNGAWALRAQLNVPIIHQSLAGGIEEVQDKVVRRITNGEAYSFEKQYTVFKDIFENTSLSNEAYAHAGLTYFGLAVRKGDLKECLLALDKMKDRFAKIDNNSLLPGLVRQRRRELEEYEKFLHLAIMNFTRAVADEEFTRSRLPDIMIAVAESLRRTGQEGSAMDWYLALAKMAEGQPKLRDDLRAIKKAPSADAPYPVQLAWIADGHIDDLTKKGLVHAPVPEGPDKGLLNAILFENLGSLEYQNPNWKPAVGANQKDCAVVIDLIGKAALDYDFRLGAWPKTLGELWEKEVIRDRNRVNRFYCPVTGKPFLYKELSGPLAQKTVIVATSEPVPTNQGPRYAAYLLNNTVVWSDKPVAPGEIYPR